MGNSIFKASRNGNLEDVKYYIETKNVPIDDAHWWDGMTPLLEAVEANQLAVVEYLLTKNANFDAKDPNGHTAMVIAVNKAHYWIVERLLRTGARIQRQDVEVLHFAAKNSRVAMVQDVLDCGVPVDARDRHDNTALLNAAASQDITMVKELMRLGANLEARDGSNDTALLAAAASHRISMIVKLIDVGADRNARDSTEKTLLLRAVSSSVDADAMASFVSRFVTGRVEFDAAATDSTGGTALHLLVSWLVDQHASRVASAKRSSREEHDSNATWLEDELDDCTHKAFCKRMDYDQCTEMLYAFERLPSMTRRFDNGMHRFSKSYDHWLHEMLASGSPREWLDGKLCEIEAKYQRIQDKAHDSDTPQDKLDHYTKKALLNRMDRDQCRKMQRVVERMPDMTRRYDSDDYSASRTYHHWVEKMFTGNGGSAREWLAQKLRKIEDKREMLAQRKLMAPLNFSVEQDKIKQNLEGELAAAAASNAADECKLIGVAKLLLENGVPLHAMNDDYLEVKTMAWSHRLFGLHAMMSRFSTEYDG